jgi:predicted ATPase/transcriptional regulator with XRE-family HTH domain
MSEPTMLSAVLKRYRLAAGLSQEALAARAELSARAISDMERGLRRAPHPDTLERLAAALRLSPQQRALLVGAARPQARVTAEASPPAPLPSLPVPPTALLGRELERVHARSLLLAGSVRMVTLTGPAGVGKTRLGLEVARDLAPEFSDSARFVDLSSVRDPSLVASAVAQVLGLREAAGVPAHEQVLADLAARQILLLVDNAEQVVDAAAWWAEVLARCPHVELLFTSRTPLRLRGEAVLPLAPLMLEDAVTLFRERARSTHPDGDYTGQAVTEICQRLDCLPLAIELAAVHVRILPVAQLAEQLDQRLALLREGMRDLPPRQRTMEDAIAWSHDLLTEAGQQVFRSLAAFVGGWTVEAAQAIGWEQAPSRQEVVLALAELVDASLVQAEVVAGQARFRLLEVTRDYACMRLRQAAEEEACQRRHAGWFARLATDAPRLASAMRSGALTRDLPNIRAALTWAEAHEEADVGMRLAGFAQVFFMQGLIEEAAHWLERMLALDEDAGRKGQVTAPPQLRGERLNGLARALLNQRHMGQADARASEAVHLAERIQDEAAMSDAYLTQGLVAQASGKLEQAAHAFTESYVFAGRAGRRDLRTRALVELGELARQRGDTARAESLLSEGLDEARARKAAWDEAVITTLLGHLAHQQQHYVVARQRYHESLLRLRAFRNPTFIAWCVEGLAATLTALGHAALAVRLCAAAAAYRTLAHTPLPAPEGEAVEQVLATARTELGAGPFAAAWAEGSAFSVDATVAEALSGSQ